MHVLIFGKDGQVGRGLGIRLADRGTVTQLGRKDVDLCDAAKVHQSILTHKPDVVVNAAAYTAVDRAESESDLANQVNGIAPGIMAQAAKAVGALLVHYSTDYVFDGAGDRPYREDDPTGPSSVYGQTKLAGEQAVEQVDGDYIILRTSWVYSLYGHNFLKTVMRLAGERDKLTIVDDQQGSPTYAESLSDATAVVIDRVKGTGERVPNYQGLYHITCSGITTWCGFARSIVARTDHADVAVAPIATGDYPTPAVRPLYSVLDNSKLEASFGLRMPHWEQALDQCLAGLSGAERR